MEHCDRFGFGDRLRFRNWLQLGERRSRRLDEGNRRGLYECRWLGFDHHDGCGPRRANGLTARDQRRRRRLVANELGERADARIFAEIALAIACASFAAWSAVMPGRRLGNGSVALKKRRTDSAS